VVYSAIQQEIKHIAEQQQRNLLSRIAKAEQDGDDIIRCYRRIEGLFRQLEVSLYHAII
jgi:hypothetical protein